MRNSLSIATLVISLGLTSLTAFAAAPKRVELAVGGMTCATCPITVRQILKKQRGVSEARVDLGSRTAVVTFDPDLVTPSQLADAVTEAGFPSKTKE